MKLISFVVCCYNSQEYMRDAVDSLLKGGEEVEIIIVDDGSKDDTPKIADEYGEKYPSIVKVVHQPNGGHGAGVMAGVRLATGTYFKIVDSDDWVDDEGYQEVLNTVRKLDGKADLIVTDFQYYHGKKPVQQNRYDKKFPQNRIFKWKEAKKLSLTENMLIQSLMYRTDILKTDGLDLPNKVFYEDTLYIYHNLFYVDNIYYLHKNFYCYNVGRPGQSVEMDTSIRRYKDFLKVGELCFKCNDPYKYKADKAKLFALYHQIRISFYMCMCYAKLRRTKESKADLKAWLKTCKATNKRLYRRLRYFSVGFPISFPGIFGYLNAKIAYNTAQKLVSFN